MYAATAWVQFARNKYMQYCRSGSARIQNFLPIRIRIITWPVRSGSKINWPVGSQIIVLDPQPWIYAVCRIRKYFSGSGSDFKGNSGSGSDFQGYSGSGSKSNFLTKSNKKCLTLWLHCFFTNFKVFDYLLTIELYNFQNKSTLVKSKKFKFSSQILFRISKIIPDPTHW